MTVLMISYDLNGHERPSAYAAVKKMIEDNSIDCRRPLYSLWWVETNDSIDTWGERMADVTDDSDNYFICRVAGHTQGFLDQALWDWLNARV